MGISSNQWSTLIDAAKVASTRAYCPYSQFPVGAAVLTDDMRIFSGCNVENASYGLTVCAERNAVFAAVGQGLTKILAIVVYTPTENPAAPCGACRQVLNEFASDTEIRCVCDGSDVIESTISEMLPFAFGPSNFSA